MTLDNSKKIISLRIKLFAATVIVLIFIVLTYIARMISYPMLGMGDTAWTLIVITIYLIYAFMPMILNYQYLFYSDDDETLIFRYFTSGLVGGRKNSVVIEKRSFSGYKIESKFFGLIRSIILFQRLPEGVAKYPPIYISALSKEETDKVIVSLKKHLPGG
jgi:hypothetical protein